MLMRWGLNDMMDRDGLRYMDGGSIFVAEFLDETTFGHSFFHLPVISVVVTQFEQ